ncbi:MULTISPECIES: flagellar export chaperone FliS [unclassified Bacillus (in: firmicutes)]|uniref:flagellar export chaperone FliS n=1 Tax=unclassified Bacillus (in: firmicutes) TaxID=185979 RepID=UPI00080AC57B|nr:MULTISPECIES: flagellar export chaperone FliS [unclassified Bacillus (in: firmicutes)]OCA84680.1 flagellar export chaperone FliS [Bacillus sp. FJAT-27986]
MAIQNPYQAYQTNTVTTASPGELTLMLYNGCLKFIKAARVAMESKQIQARHENLLKAQNIISELRITLNMDMAISQNMMAMYDYINSRLIEANTKNDPAMLDEAEELVLEFRDTWKQAIQLNRRKQYTSGGHA